MISERRIRSIPPQIEQSPGGFIINDHVRKPTKEFPNKPLIVPDTERITWEVEVQEDCIQGRLWMILQFTGIEFVNTTVFKGGKKDYGPDSRIFYCPVRYKNAQAFLILATFGDIVETQVVVTKIDDRPFFREETILPQLGVTHNSISMSVYEKNHLIVVSYDKL